MKNIFILENTDIILPTDYSRPLARSASYSYSDAWIEESPYDGSPCDHLRWAPVWLVLGDVWWGKQYGEFVNFNKDYPARPFEAVRGDIPISHIIDLKKYEHRHPLWYERYAAVIADFEKQIFAVGKYKGSSFKKYIHSDPDYVSWYISNIKPEWRETWEIYPKYESYKVYYSPKYKKFAKS